MSEADPSARIESQSAEPNIQPTLVPEVPNAQQFATAPAISSAPATPRAPANPCAPVIPCDPVISSAPRVINNTVSNLTRNMGDMSVDEVVGQGKLYKANPN